jgi:hypothetical protein
MSLSRSQRIKLITEIGNRLGAEDYSLIDLTLKQFSQPRQDTWSGSRESYVMGMIQDGSDESLIELAQHLGYAVERSTNTRIEPEFWREGMFRLFISHLAVHKVWAARLQQALLHFGISSFVAHNDIEPTSEWQEQIEAALATCEGLVALLHPNFHLSKWTDQEIGFAMGRSVPVFSVRFGEVPYGFIGKFQAFNGAKKEPIELAEDLFESFRKNKQTQKRMSEILVRFFETSDTFAEAKTRVQYLSDMEVWEPSFSNRIKKAAEENYQISNSFGVPERVASLIQRRAAESKLSK